MATVSNPLGDTGSSIVTVPDASGSSSGDMDAAALAASQNMPPMRTFLAAALPEARGMQQLVQPSFEPDATLADVVKGFECMMESRVSFLFTNRTTHSDVMTVTTTVVGGGDEYLRLVRKRGGPATSTTSSSSASLSSSSSAASLQPRAFIPAPPSLRKGAFSVGSAKKAKALIRERDEFMAKLRREREETHVREHLAAVRIQAVWRGYAVRPKAAGRRPPRSARSAAQSEVDEEMWREQLRQLTMRTEAHLNGMEYTEDGEWRREVKNRAAGKRARKARRRAEHNAAASIQALVLMFITRRAYRRMQKLLLEEEQHTSAARMQALVRGYNLRRKLLRQVTLQRNRAALRIQSVARSQAAKTKVSRLHHRLDKVVSQEHAAIAIQRVARGRQGRKRMQSKKSTDAAVRVQSLYRGHRARRGLSQASKDRQAAAVKMQAAARGRADRKKVDAKRKQRKQEHAAATKIQSRARGRAARQKVTSHREMREQARKKAAEEAEALAAARKAEEEAAAAAAAEAAAKKAAAEEAEAAAKRAADEAAAKEAAAKRRAEEREAAAKRAAAEKEAAAKRTEEEKEAAAAAVRIQAAARGKRDRKAVLAKKKAKAEAEEAKAATSMQRVARGKRDRQRVAKLKAERKAAEEAKQAKAAVAIQSAARGRKARKEVSKVRAKRHSDLASAATDAPRRRRRKKRDSRASRTTASRSSGGSQSSLISRTSGSGWPGATTDSALSDLSGTGYSEPEYEDLGPLKTLKVVLDRTPFGLALRPSLLGVGVGVAVEHTRTESPLHGEVQLNDRLVAIDGNDVREMEFLEMRSRLRKLSEKVQGGGSTTLVFERPSDATKHVKTLDRAPFGVFLKAAVHGGSVGATIEKMSPTSPLDGQVQPGDILTDIEGQDVTHMSFFEIRELLRAHAEWINGGRKARLTFQRGGRRRKQMAHRKPSNATAGPGPAPGGAGGGAGAGAPPRHPVGMPRPPMSMPRPPG